MLWPLLSNPLCTFNSLRRRALVLAMALAFLLGFGPQPSLAQQAANDSTGGEINLGTVGSSGQTTHVGTLSAGKALFWSGPFVEESFLVSPEQCGLRGSGCFDYQIEIDGPAARLRVAIDHPNLGDVFDIRLFDPSGADVTDTTQLQRSAGGPFPLFTIWSHETFAKHPDPGVWTARVAPLNTNNSAFRMRAMLEEEPKEGGPRRLLLPNLKMAPPYEFTFSAAEKPNAEQPQPSCFDAEAKYLPSVGEWRCLRFSAGPENVGQGRFEVVFPPGEGIASEGKAQQRVYFSDGTFEDRAAGTFTYHREHHHFHHTAIGGFELLRVENPRTGALTSVSEGPKIGMCLGDTFIADWQNKKNDLPADTSGATACAGSPSGGVFGLTKGWGDIYPWWAEGNFVPFPENAADGLYVVRVVADTKAEGTATFAETNETDNTSYAYIHVEGADIEVLERGQGTSPWDPAKTITLDGRPPNPDCPALETQRTC